MGVLTLSSRLLRASIDLGHNQVDCWVTFAYSVTSLQKIADCDVIIKTFLFTFQAITLHEDYFGSPGIPTVQRYLDEPHSLVKIIDGIELKA